jgi:putative hydrolase of the HAD superfamily
MPEFIYFDMGNVLLHFSHEREAEQIARVAGLAPAAVWKLLFADGLHWQAERGELSRRQFYERFCELTKSRPDFAAFEEAGNDIFWLNEAIVPIVAALREAGRRLGVLSNTSEAHWDHCTRKFPLLTESFPVHALSFRIGAMKPDPRVYAAAADLAGFAGGEILFIDDRPDNFAAARQAGWQAVAFESASQLAKELAACGILHEPDARASSN